MAPLAVTAGAGVGGDRVHQYYKARHLFCFGIKKMSKESQQPHGYRWVFQYDLLALAIRFSGLQVFVCCDRMSRIFIVIRRSIALLFGSYFIVKV